MGCIYPGHGAIYSPWPSLPMHVRPGSRYGRSDKDDAVRKLRGISDLAVEQIRLTPFSSLKQRGRELFADFQHLFGRSITSASAACFLVLASTSFLGRHSPW